MACVFLGMTSLVYHGYIHFLANNFTLLFSMSEKSDYGCKSHLSILLLRDTRSGSITQLCEWCCSKHMCLHLCKANNAGGIARSRGSSIFSFLRNFHTDSQSGWTSFYSHQQRWSSLCLHLGQNLRLLLFWLGWGGMPMEFQICISDGQL